MTTSAHTEIVVDDIGLEGIKVLLGQALASNGPPDRCIGWVLVL